MDHSQTIDFTDHTQPIDWTTPLDRLIEKEEANTPDQRTTLAAMIDYIFGQGMHPAEVIRRTYQLAIVLNDSLLVYAVLNSNIPRILSGTPDDVANSLRSKPIANAASAATAILQAAQDSGLLKPHTYTGNTLPDFSADEKEIAAAIYHRVLFSSGANPRNAVRKIYLITKALYPHLVGGASLEILGKLSGETRQDWSINGLKLLDAIKDRTGSTASGATFTRTDQARSNYEKSAKQGWTKRKAKKQTTTEDDYIIG